MKKLIVGLGNPGPEYKNTRHNAGYMALDLLAKSLGISLNHEKHQSVCGRGRQGDGELILAKPLTFMNMSGDSVALWARKEGLDPSADLLVVCDEMQLDLGRVRLRPEGSAGSHNGLASIIERLGTRQFARLRLGIGRPGHPAQWADYVLEKFRPEEREALGPALEKAAQGCELWAGGESMEKVMSKVNAN